MTSTKTLLFFTHSFPFGQQERSFIEPELKHLAMKFDRIIILPFVYESKEPLAVPSNVEVRRPLIGSENRLALLLKGIFNTIALKPFFTEVSANLGRLKPASFLKLIRDTIIARYALSRPAVKEALKNENAALYFYWGLNWSYILPFSPRKLKSVVRFHRYDLYEEKAEGRYLPYREGIFAAASHPTFISQHGLDYALTKYRKLNGDMRLMRLGVKSNGLSSASTDGVFRIVTCSNLVPVKRVHLVAEALKSITDIPVIWTHFGDGTEKSRVFLLAEQFPRNVKLDFKGYVTNDLVQKYYLENPVDLFINVSESEGLPVSIMEVMASGIPVLATDVGGSAELIQDRRYLLAENLSARELTDAIRTFFLNHYGDQALRQKAFENWQNISNGERNYSAFADFLSGLTPR